MWQNWWQRVWNETLKSAHITIIHNPVRFELTSVYLTYINESHELNTIIFSTHDIELAVELADSIYILGYKPEENGQLGNVGTILKHFDLKQMGLAWQDCFTGQHLECVQMIKDLMLKS